MEASALQHRGSLSGSAGRSPLLRLRSDEQLIAMTRRGNQAAFEMLVRRYEPRLLAFCRHMLSSKEDAEDVLQEVFAASYNALLADNRPINTRPWLYRIARNRCLNHLRKPKPSGQDSMDIFERDNGTSTADTVHRREEFRQIVADVGLLPETQRSALLLREIDALSYEQIAEAMDTTVPSVKSLLVRARVSLAEAAEARLLTCGEVRLELGQVAEGLAKTSAPVRRHLKTCPQCRTFRDELRKTNRALAAVFPIGPLVILHKVGLAKLFGGGAAAGAGAGAAGAGGGTVAGGAAGLAAGGAAAAGGGAVAAGGAISAITGTIAGKAAAGMAAAAIVTAGAVEVNHVTRSNEPVPPATPAVAAHPAPPAAPAGAGAEDEDDAEKSKKAKRAQTAGRKEREAEEQEPEVAVEEEPAAPEPATTTSETPPTTTTPAAPTPPPVQEDEGTVTLPSTPPPATEPPPTTVPVTPPKPPPPPPATTTPTPPPTATVPPPTTTTPTAPKPPPLPNGAAPAPPPAP
ncbi:MAG: sigma-70 family RNA polymerase sigma factor [Solirubrobacterales bacterium]|nr:sigma-70 family RNA polymerase sigma factor [Solirubrobacterales bacterium]